MKLRVVGWTYYDDDLVTDDSWAAHMATVDDIKKHGYEFCGWSHQECQCCAPVFNNGKMLRCSQRGWGSVMAEAHGLTGRLDYTTYAFMVDPEQLDSEIHPTDEFDEENFQPEVDLEERFELAISQDVFDDAQNGGEIKVDDLPELRYLDVSDTLALACGEQTAEYSVVAVDRKRDLTEEELLDFEMAFYDFEHDERRKRANAEYNKIKVVMIIKLKKPKI